MSTDDTTLYHAIVKLAYDNPALRAKILPVITEFREAKSFKDQMDQAGVLDAVDPTVAKLITQSGHRDGDRGDDVVRVTKGSWPAAKLKPSQTSMVLGKALGMALFMLKTGLIGGDLGALISSDNHILDGHHRWAATILASGGSGMVGGYKASLPGKELLKVLNIISKGTFNVRGGKPGKGSLAQFTSNNVKGMLQEFVEQGIPGEFPWSAEDVKAVLETNFGSVEAGIETLAGNVGLMSKQVPGWAPDRKQMPVIDPDKGHVDKAVKMLNQGIVDWNEPHMTPADERLAKQLLRLAKERPSLRPAVISLLKP